MHNFLALVSSLQGLKIRVPRKGWKGEFGESGSSSPDTWCGAAGLGAPSGRPLPPTPAPCPPPQHWTSAPAFPHSMFESCRRSPGRKTATRGGGQSPRAGVCTSSRGCSTRRAFQ